MLYVACIVLAGRQDLVSIDNGGDHLFGDWDSCTPKEAKKSQIICSQSLIL